MRDRRRRLKKRFHKKRSIKRLRNRYFRLSVPPASPVEEQEPVHTINETTEMNSDSDYVEEDVTSADGDSDSITSEDEILRKNPMMSPSRDLYYKQLLDYKYGEYLTSPIGPGLKLTDRLKSSQLKRAQMFMDYISYSIDYYGFDLIEFMELYIRV